KGGGHCGPEQERREEALPVPEGGAVGGVSERGVDDSEARQSAGRGQEEADHGSPEGPPAPLAWKLRGAVRGEGRDPKAEDGPADVGAADLTGRSPEPGAHDESKQAQGQGGAGREV